jgi:glycosyltransferase involved in cell wall biosynthesis
MKVTAFAPYPVTGPSTRFRLAHFVEPLAGFGITLEIVPFLEADEFAGLYGAGGVFAKASLLGSAHRRRSRAVAEGCRADIVLIHREIAPVFDGRFVRAVRRSGRPVVFDFDDAVFLPPRGGNPLLRLIRRPRAVTARLCRMADAVLAGNDYLAKFAAGARGGSGEGVEHFPTVIDTDAYTPRSERPTVPPTLGWIGTHSTVPYLEALFPLLAELQARHGFRLLVVSNLPPRPFPGLDVDFRRWEADAELAYLHEMDIGLYPLPNDSWTRGKCGFKAIQYMSCGIPVVASGVGVLPEILMDGAAGLLAADPAAWAASLERLLADDSSAAIDLGSSGRARVVDAYSVARAAPRMAELFHRLGG